MRSASSDEAEPAMVPPSADSTLELHDKLTAVVDTLRSVASKTSETESTVEKIASDMRIHVVLELMQSFASLKVCVQPCAKITRSRNLSFLRTGGAARNERKPRPSARDSAPANKAAQRIQPTGAGVPCVRERVLEDRNFASS